MLGDLLDNRYRIIRTLSKGGFGQTYIAEDTRLPGHPYCVLKHLEPVALDEVQMANARRLFETEAIALGRLGEHPQIPRLLAYFEEKGDFYIVQDLVRGYPLSKELKEGEKWPEAHIYCLLHDVLSVLVFVHDRGVIHRDIKPDNLIRRQSDRALVLVDFGSVKQIRTQTPISDETGQTIAIGTMGYMAMEQARGRPRPNSDLYSLGIIGVQAATGIKPRFFQEDFETGELVWRNEADVSDDMADFLTKLVAYHFKDRYGDAWEALRELEQLSVANRVNHSASTRVASHHWPNSFTFNHVAPSTNANPSVADRAFASMPDAQTTETVADMAQVLASEHNDPQELVPQPTVIERPEKTDIFQVPLQDAPTSPSALPRDQQDIADTVTLDMGSIQRGPKESGRDRPVTSTQPLPSATPRASGPASRPTHQPANNLKTHRQNHSPKGSVHASSSAECLSEEDVTAVLPDEHTPNRTQPGRRVRRKKNGPTAKIERRTGETSASQTSSSQIPPSQIPSSQIPSPQTVASTYPQRFLVSPLPTISHLLQSGWNGVNQALSIAKTKRADKSRRSPTIFPNATVMIAGSISTLVVLGLGVRSYNDFQEQQRLSLLVQSIESQHGTRQYEQCREQAQHLQTISPQMYDTAIELEGRCALAQAKQLAEQQDFMGAITVAKAVPAAAQAYDQSAQDLIKEWFVLSLKQAEIQYEQGSVNAAIATAINLTNNIPPDHPLQTKIQLTALKWTLEQNWWQKAQHLLDDRQWQAAIDQAQPLLALPPFENKATGLITEATSNLTIENQREDMSSPVIIEPTQPDRESGMGIFQNNVVPSRPQKR